jgi:ppGpp synthetase/RelA/SpoT-type nucleotidyltranferase
MKAKKPTKAHIESVVGAYTDRRDEIDLFRQQVAGFFEKSRHFATKPLPLVHSVKSRLKDPDHLAEKVRRKWTEKQITPETLFQEVNDLAGVRVLHLYTEQFSQIHAAIEKHLHGGFWILAEKPVAYSWDPETTDYFKSLGLHAEVRETYYSSVHYVVKPHSSTDISCEIQVRTLFEEIWGEIDHAINYPEKTSVIACREQLRVLAKLASTGTRLADSIFKISTTAT